MKDVVTLIKFFPVEIFIIMVAMGVASGYPFWADVSVSILSLLFLSMMIGIVRGIYHVNCHGGFSDQFADSEAPDFESEPPATDPWCITRDQMIAAREYPPAKPEVTAFTLEHMAKLIAAVGEIANEMASTLPATGGDHPTLYEMKSNITNLAFTCVRTGGQLKQQAAWLKKARVPDNHEVGSFEYSPHWEGSGPIESDRAAILLMDLTVATRELISLGIALGLPTDDGFNRLAAHIDDTRNHYGLIERNPITGAWPGPRSVDYGQIVTEHLKFRGAI